jgi:hypothetical protein
VHIAGLRKERVRSLAAGGLFGLGLLSSALAAPAIGTGRATPPPVFSVQPSLIANRSIALEVSAKLDLRLNENSAAKASLMAVSFPSAFHPSALRQTSLAQDDRIQPHAVGASNAHFQEMSQPEMFARRVHQEGPPIAQLWESKSALLSMA